MADNVKKLKLASIVVDADLQPRVKGLDDAHVAELAAAYRTGKPVPPCRVFVIDGEPHLTRGFHRCAAAADAGVDALEFEVHQGDREAAKLDAAASNANHGLKRSRDDKRRAVLWVISLCADWTNAKIADHCGVDSSFVDTVRAEVAAVAAARGSRKPPSHSVKRNGEPAKTKGKRAQGGGNPTGGESKKAASAADAAELLKANPTRLDDEIAAELNCKPKVVALARKALIAEGIIPGPVKPPKAKPEAAEGDPENPALDPRFMPNAAEAEAFADQFRNWVARLRAVRAEMRKALPDRNHVLANRIDAGGFDAALGDLIETLDKNVPTCVCPVCVGTGTADDATCKYCDGYGVVDKHHHDGLKAKWKHTRARLLELAGAA